MHLKYHLTREADEAVFVLYTMGYRKITRYRLPCLAGENRAAVDAGVFKGLSPGIYYWRLDAQGNGQKAGSGAQTLVILR